VEVAHAVARFQPVTMTANAKADGNIHCITQQQSAC